MRLAPFVLVPKEIQAFEQTKGELHERIVQLDEHITQLKAKRKATPRHIPISELPEEARFERLSTQSKHFIDTLKMIAYRAETAMAHLLREHMTRQEDARTLRRAIYATEIDLVPNLTDKTPTVRPIPWPTTVQTSLLVNFVRNSTAPRPFFRVATCG